MVVHAIDCLACGALLPGRPFDNPKRLLCEKCWSDFRQNYSRNISRLDVIAELFDAHWVALGLQQAAA